MQTELKTITQLEPYFVTRIEESKCKKKAFDCEGQFEIKVIPSYSCDQRCPFCYGKYINKEFFVPNRKKLTATLARLLSRPDANVIVEIIGGDPLSKINFPETKALVKYLNSLGRNVKIMVQTAGNNVEDIKELIPGIDALSYSIDLSESPKTRNLSNLESLAIACKEHNTVMQVQTILSPKDTHEDAFKHIRRCIAAGVRFLGIEYPQYQSYSKEEMDRQIEFYADLYKQREEFKEIAFGGIIESLADFFDGVFYTSTCMCGERSVVVEPDGSVVPSFHFGLKVLSIEDFVRAKALREERLQEGNCAGCECWRICKGGCMEHSRFITGDLYSHDPEFCYVFRGVVEKLRA